MLRALSICNFETRCRSITSGSFAMTVHVDGPLLLRSEPYEAAELLNRLQRESKLPLLFAADFERGVATRLMGTTNFPHAMAFGGDGKLEDAENFGRITAKRPAPSGCTGISFLMPT